MSHFKIATAEYIHSLTNRRKGETKLGETVRCCANDNWEETLQSSSAKFVLIGIPEDIGVKANYGVGGTETLWEPALKSILNVQETTKIKGDDLLVLGYFDFVTWMERAEKKDIDALRMMVADIDNEVYPVIEKVVKAGKIPIIVGGGHNNAYPILKGVSKGKGSLINCINLDAHSDYRNMEGRHSGNGFRYAKVEGYLRRYVAIGLHESYNSQKIIDDLDADADIAYYMYEDIFLNENVDFKTILDRSVSFVNSESTGIELDLDAITNILSSATTPCGISSLQARRYVTHMARFADTAYLHITEGAVRLADGRGNILTAKLVAYLITDFIRAYTVKYL